MCSPWLLRKRSASFTFFNEATLGCRGYTKSPSVCRASARETNVCLTSFSRRTLIVNRRQPVAGAGCDDGDIPVSTLWSVIFVSPRSLFRTTASADPRDQTPVSRLLRWRLNRPLLFATIFVVGLVSITATLLVVGPPGGRSCASRPIDGRQHYWRADHRALAHHDGGTSEQYRAGRAEFAQI